MPFAIKSGAKITPRLTGQHEFTTTRRVTFLDVYGARIIQAAALGAVLAFFLH